MPFLTIAAKDLRLLLRDPRSAVILVVMPLVLILVLGLALGEAFGRKPDDQLQLTVVDEDRGLSADFDAYPSVWAVPKKGPVGAVIGGPAALPLRKPYPPTGRWADVVLADVKNTGDIRIERVATRTEAEQLVRRGKRSAVVVFEPEFSEKMDRCSFVGEPFKRDPINPMNKNGVRTDRVGITVLANDAQPVGAAVTKQITQVSLMRVVIPWMIGQAFDWIGSPLFMERMEKYIPQLKLAYSFFSRETLGAGIKKGIQGFFEEYDFTAPTWHGLTKDRATEAKDGNDTQFEEPPAFGRGTKRYQVLVPSYAVTFAFFLVLTSGWLFVAERRHGTLVRLEAAPIGLEQLLLGKLIPCLIVSVIQGLVLLGCGKLVFGMSWGPEPLLLLPVVLATSFAAVGMAVLVGVMAKTEAQVSVYGTLLVLVLAGLSGSMMPREMMPESMRQLSKVTPHAWALDAYEHLLYPDATTVDAGVVWLDCGVLALFGLGFLAVAWAWQAVGRRLSW
jgi:ABC-type Na+ efflux pump permease subunit